MHQAQLGLWAQRVLKASKVQLEELDLLVEQEHLEGKDLKGLLDQQGNPVPQDPKALQGIRDKWGHPGQPGFLEIPVPLDQWVLME